jgi:hypothetical protein
MTLTFAVVTTLAYNGAETSAMIDTTYPIRQEATATATTEAIEQTRGTIFTLSYDGLKSEYGEYIT